MNLEAAMKGVAALVLIVFWATHVVLELVAEKILWCIFGAIFFPVGCLSGFMSIIKYIGVI